MQGLGHIGVKKICNSDNAASRVAACRIFYLLVRKRQAQVGVFGCHYLSLLSDTAS